MKSRVFQPSRMLFRAPQPEKISPVARALALDGHPVPYLLIRKRGRRGISMRVDHRGLAVSAPLTMRIEEIETMIAGQAKWVLSKVAEWASRRVPEMRWENGVRLPYLGREVTLELVAAAGRDRVEMTTDRLLVAVSNRSEENVGRRVVAWYRREALVYLAQRAFQLSRLHGLPVPRVLVSNALGRWGSCNARREIRFAWRLLKARPAIIDYVVCHELAHLRHMNHSREFWAEVGKMCPEYSTLRSELDAADHLYRAF